MRMEWRKYGYTMCGKTADTLSPRPLIETVLSNKTGKFPVLSMIDSGTDSTVANADIAKALHISPNTCQKVKLGGIGGNKEGSVCDITIFIPDFRLSMQVPVIFVEDPAFDVLLGQLHFFNEFKPQCLKLFNIEANLFQLA